MTAVGDLRRPQRYLAIIALALVAYWPTLHVGFLWDDHVLIETNSSLREWSKTTLKHDFTTDVFDGHGDPYFRPAATMLNRVNFSLWGLHPLGYHLTNWAGHALNALLFQELVIALGFGNLVALLVGCLFAVHPMPVEQLLIVSGCAEIFSLAFTLISLLLLLREDMWAWILGYLSMGMALLFKESALITPALFACLFAYKKRRLSLPWKLWPLFTVMAPYLILRQHAVGPLLNQVNIGFMLKFFIEAFPKILLIYIRLLFIPWNLHSHRMVPHLSHVWPLFLAFWIGGVGYLFYKKSWASLLGVAWFVLAILPKTPVMIYGNFMLDHWAYAASFGLFLPLACAYEWAWKGRRALYKNCLGLTLFPLLIFWALTVALNVALRDTDEKMYRWALHFSESHPIKYNLGILLIETGRAQEAIPYLEDVRSAYPNDVNNRHALALAYTKTGHPKIAQRLMTDPSFQK